MNKSLLLYKNYQRQWGVQRWRWRSNSAFRLGELAGFPWDPCPGGLSISQTHTRKWRYSRARGPLSPWDSSWCGPTCILRNLSRVILPRPQGNASSHLWAASTKLVPPWIPHSRVVGHCQRWRWGRPPSCGGAGEWKHFGKRRDWLGHSILPPSMDATDSCPNLCHFSVLPKIHFLDCFPIRGSGTGFTTAAHDN